MKQETVFVTGVQGGISEAEQKKIALELILAQGGVAIMQQIYAAVEERLPENHFLSPQGKHSLRRIVNTQAVQNGYIYPYDKSNPGWRITEAGVDFVRHELGKEIGNLKFTARATVNFGLAIKEIRGLLGYYSSLSEDEKRSNINPELFKRSSIILVVTAWESFVEDMLGLHINHRLNIAQSPDGISKAFNAVANGWYIAILNKYDNHPKPEDFRRWTGDNWKELIREKLREDLIALNTPKSKNISNLSKRYLGVDITQQWSMPRITAHEVSDKLDQIIEMRGEITHRIANYFEAKSKIGQGALIGNVDFVERLAKRIESVLDSI